MNDRIIGDADKRYKIILVGDVSVGKTALVWRFIAFWYIIQIHPTKFTLNHQLSEKQ